MNMAPMDTMRIINDFHHRALYRDLSLQASMLVLQHLETLRLHGIQPKTTGFCKRVMKQLAIHLYRHLALTLP
jgi:hypothetical protein